MMLLSAGLLWPYFWQPAIHGGDLPSHLHNSWIGPLIEQGHAPGLWIAHQLTHMAFDVPGGWLLGIFDLGAAERIAVSAAVLVFFWGVFALVCTVTRQRPWFITPCLGMLAYGYVFHVGLFRCCSLQLSGVGRSATESRVLQFLYWRGWLTRFPSCACSRLLRTFPLAANARRDLRLSPNGN